MSKYLYIIRHGQTDLNIKGIVQGKGIDSPLNEIGFQQANAFFEAYKHISFDRIYVSQLRRTYQTVEPFVQMGIPFAVHAGLDEIGWGIYEGLEQSPEILSGFQDLISQWSQGDLDRAVEGGESPNQLILRQKEAMKYIMSQEQEENVLICMHGRAMRILLSWMSNGDPRHMDQFKHTNTALYKVHFDGSRFDIVDSYNIQHLDSMHEFQIKKRVSVVSYTNSLPFLYGLENSPISKKIEISKDIPSVCAFKLAHNQADIGIVPIASLDDYQQYEIMSNFCIGSDGAVDSVFIFSELPMDEIRTIRLDEHSRTSNGLARILMKHFWKKDVKWVREGEADAFVQIGDRTFGQKQKHPFYFDLSAYWKEWTGLPFVFAVWVSTSSVSEEFRAEFDQAIQIGLDNRDKITASLSSKDGFDIGNYLQNSIDYRFDQPKKEAMRLYLQWLRELD